MLHHGQQQPEFAQAILIQACCTQDWLEDLLHCRTGDFGSESEPAKAAQNAPESATTATEAASSLTARRLVCAILV